MSDYIFSRNNALQPLKKHVRRKSHENNQKKPSQTRIGRFEPVFVVKKPNQNRSVWIGFSFFKNNQFNYFFNKNQTETKNNHP
jgi:hypothetical protein